MVAKDKVRAIMLATAAGDTLGKTVEMFSAEKIKKRFGRITTYLSPPDDHKWAAGWPANRWTDDTSMTLAVLKALTESGGIDMDTMVKHHIIEYDKNEAGFGPKTSTARAIEALKSGKHWSETGSPNGKGNGAAMKAAPLGIYLAILKERNVLKYYSKILSVFPVACMTHNNCLGKASGIVQAWATLYCIGDDDFTKNGFAKGVASVAYGYGNNEPDVALFIERLSWLSYEVNVLALLPPEYIHMEPSLFGNGRGNVPDSLPFTYAHFLRNPRSIETLFDVINAGGDTDTNGAMCGALLGALNGMKLFDGHEYLIEELWRKDELIAAADAFCEKFGIE